MKSISIVILGSLIFIGSCKNNSVNSEPVPMFIPLSVGNQWVFQRATTGINLPFPDIDTVSFLISEAKTISDQIWYRRKYMDKSLPFDPNVPWSWAYSNSSDGVLNRAVSSDSSSSAYLRYKYPCKVSERYKTHTMGIFNGQFVIDTAFVTTILSTDSVITVPAGTYHCVVYRSISIGNNQYVEENYISPEYGWIRNVNTNYFSGNAVKTKEIYDAISISIH